MAIVQNMWLKKAKKRLGGTVLYQAMEQTRQRELAVSVANPRTTSQMTQRVKWANLVNFYRVNGSWMKYAFETKSAQQSEYNKFMSVNAPSSQIYLTKQLASMGACVVAPYIVTQGSLMPVEVTAGAGSWSSNLYLTDGFTLTQATTVGELATALLACNPALRQGDQLSFIRFTQMSNADTGAPYVIVRRSEILLNASSVELVKDYLPLDYIQVNAGDPLPCLAVHDSGLAGGFVLIISRTTGGKTYVSTQRVVVANNAATIAQYSGSAALADAIASYGDSADAFLSSDSASGTASAPIPYSILSVTKDTQTTATGVQRPVVSWDASDVITVNFNNPVAGDAVSGVVLLSNNTSFNCAAAIADGKVNLTLPVNFPEASSAYLKSISVTIDGTTYTGVWLVPASADDDLDG